MHWHSWKALKDLVHSSRRLTNSRTNAATDADKKPEQRTNTDEYRELEQRSKDLQAMINKWRPIYEERLKMVKEAQKAAKK